MTSRGAESLRAPDLLQGSMAPFSFSPLSPAPSSSSSSYTAPVRPMASPTFRILPSALPHRPAVAKRKGGVDGEGAMEGVEPVRKVHLSEEVVAQTMADLHISHPRPKVARRAVGADVAEAMSLTSLEGLEDRFHQTSLVNSRDDLPLPPQRSRKVAGRSRGGAQLRLSIHQELKSLRSSTSILPESLVARYRPQPRQAVVLWTPPLSVSLLPDLVSSALRNTEQRPSGCGRHRTRCYSEVTSTPYSSHENLLACSDSDMPDLATCEGPSMGPPLPCSASSASTAEAPELSYGEPACVPPGCSLQRRNSAPEISEPSPYVDDGSMEL